MKTLEIYYDISSISNESGDLAHALDFRNKAMEHIENALMEAGAGEWVGAEIGSGEVNFGFDVEDFDHAEQVVLSAVAGTPYEGIREMEHREFDEEEFQKEMELQAANLPWKIKMMIFLSTNATKIIPALVVALILALIF